MKRINTRHSEPEGSEPNPFLDKTGDTSRQMDRWFFENYGVDAVDISRAMGGSLELLSVTMAMVFLVPGFKRFMLAPSFVATFMRAHELGHCVDELRGVDPTGQSWKAYQWATRALAMGAWLPGLQTIPLVKVILSTTVLAEEARASFYAFQCMRAIGCTPTQTGVSSLLLFCAWMTYVHAFYSPRK
jgi:hypothetical protein